MAVRYPYNQDWYAVKYSLAALNANESVRLRRLEADRAQGPPPAHGEHSDVKGPKVKTSEDRRRAALEQANELALTSHETLHALRASSWTDPATAWRRSRVASARRRRVLRGYLEDAMFPAAVVLIAGMIRNDDRSESLETDDDVAAALRRDAVSRRELADYVEKLPRRAPRVDYNLACLYAEWDQATPALRALRRSLAATPVAQRAGLAERASRDPTLERIKALIPGTNTGEGFLKWLEDKQDP